MHSTDIAKIEGVLEFSGYVAEGQHTILTLFSITTQETAVQSIRLAVSMYTSQALAAVSLVWYISSETRRVL